jgi:hypothetical protein
MQTSVDERSDIVSYYSFSVPHTAEGEVNQYLPNVKNVQRSKLDWLFVKRLLKVLVITCTRIPKQNEKKISILNTFIVLVLLSSCIGEIFLGNEVGKAQGSMSKAIMDAKEPGTDASTFLHALWYEKFRQIYSF